MAAIDNTEETHKRPRRPAAREDIVGTAIQVITESGFAGASTPVIAERAKVSRGALQHYFPYKHDLLVAILERVWTWMDSGHVASIKPDSPLKEKVEAVVDQYWLVYSSKSYIAALEIELNARFDPELAARVTERIDATSRLRDLEWIRIFADSPLSREEILSARSMMLDMLRGMAIRRIAAFRSVDVSRELSLLKSFLVEALSRRVSA